MKTTIDEMKNILGSINSRFEITGEKITEIEAIAMETTQN